LKGEVDKALRALLAVDVRSSQTDASKRVTVWADTAFNGYLVFPRKLIDKLGLQQEAATDAVLADGNTVMLESYVCYVDWFGRLAPAQVIANEGSLPLLGTEFLDNRVLSVDYAGKTVSLK
jgi:clan AA aspartic protease